MKQVYYVGKRSLKDILRTGVFWVIVGLAALLLWTVLYVGWTNEENIFHEDVSASDFEGEPDLEMIAAFETKPEANFLWWSYGFTIWFSNLLAVFVMLGLLSRDLDLKRIDVLVARPLTRTQLFFGKLIAGWLSIFTFMMLMMVWSYICMLWSGMGIQKGYSQAILIGTLAPCLIGTVVYVMSLYIKGLVSGVIGMVILASSNSLGLVMINAIEKKLLHVKLASWLMYKIMPPMNVIGEHATDNLLTGMFSFLSKLMYEDMYPTAADGLYTELWHVGVYFLVVLSIGVFSFARRQFT